MLKALFGTIHGIFSLFLIIANTLLCSTPLLFIAFFKVIIPLKKWHKFCNIFINGLAEIWVSINSANISWSLNVQWEIEGLEDLKNNEWYLVISNHQSWVDIVVLQYVFNKKIPFLKFFLKKVLIWVPVLGLAWWALDFPFMKRYTHEYIKKHPEKKGKDIEITRKACAKFKDIPVSVMNFVEGTRFTETKSEKSRSSFKNLLTPKAGGVGFVLSSMGEELNYILNVAIVYSEGDKNLWNFMQGNIKKIKVNIEKIEITDDLRGNYINDENFKAYFQKWINTLWTKKDTLIEKMKSEMASPSR